MTRPGERQRGKRLLVVGAGAYQHYIYETARNFGIWVCSVDANPNSPMFARSDDYRVIDFSDHRSVVSYAESQGVDAVATINIDQGMVSVAKIQEGLGVPFKDLDSIRAATRKDLMRCVWKEAGISQPRFWVFSEGEKQEIIDWAVNQEGDLIIKPVDNAAKRGVARLVGGREALRVVVDEAFSESKSKMVIVEEMIEGTLVFAATYLDAKGIGRVFLIRQDLGENFVQMAFDAPFTFGSEVDKRVMDEAVRAARCFGPGPYHTEVIVTSDGIPYLVETSPRVSYATVALSRLVDGFDPVLQVLQEAFQEEFDVGEAAPHNAHACLQHLCPKAGSVVRAREIWEVCDENLYEVVPLVPDGHVVKPFRTNADRVFYYTAFADSSKGLQEVRGRFSEYFMRRCFVPAAEGAI